MSRDPQNAWRVLNQAQPQTVANKLFVMEWFISWYLINYRLLKSC
jgi:hypothetical protein